MPSSHATATTSVYLEENNVFYFKTPTESPDLNPIELVWHDLKVYFKEESKPKNSAQLLAVIIMSLCMLILSLFKVSNRVRRI